MPPTSPRERHRRSRAVLAIGAGVLAAVCTPPRRPDAGPSPSPGLPDAPPQPPIEQRMDPRAFHQRGGTFAYEIAGEATVDVRSDTLPADTLRLSAHVTYIVDTAGAGGAGPRVVGRVERYDVRSSRPGLADPDSVLPPFAFEGVVGASGIELPLPPVSGVAAGDSAASDGPDTGDPELVERPCLAALSAPVALARELLFLPPELLTVGASWTDTTVTTLCRGGVPVTTTAVQRFAVVGRTRIEGDDAVAIDRASEVTIDGTTRLRGRVVSVRGTGRGRATFYASVARGALLGADAAHETELTVESGARRQTFVQSSRQRARLTN